MVKNSKQQNKDNLQLRPPVVVILGHVDSGKTSILDAIRKTRVAEKESGGITQHIGAYQMEYPSAGSGPAGKITFIDTPGHEAFSAMRSRGAKVANIAVLVVDATQGVQAQTKEAISQAKLAGIPIIVVLNKIDNPEANLEKVKGELAKEGILIESMGGKIPSVKVSAKTGQGIAELLEIVLLVAEMEELTADLDKPAEGVVIESYLDNLRGVTAILLLTQGTLKVGEVIGTPSALTKIKSLENFQKIPLKKALPADPVIVFGFNEAPKVGEEFKVFPDLESAQNYLKISDKKAPEISAVTEEQKVLNLILKSDVAGSAEAIGSILKNLPQEKVILRILKSESGDIDESDLKLAKSTNSLILGFRVKVNPVAKKLTERERFRIMNLEIIYDLVEGIRKLMEKIMTPEEVRVDLGKAKVLAKFLTEKNRQIVGGRVIEGEVKKGSSIEVFREEELIGKGKMINLHRYKKDVEQVLKGEECGILFEGDVKIEEGDILVFYTEEKRKIL